MDKEYLIRLAQLINEYPTLLIKAWVDADSLSSDLDFLSMLLNRRTSYTMGMSK